MTSAQWARLRDIASSTNDGSAPGANDGPRGTLACRDPNWRHMTDKALRRRGLVTIERAAGWWRLRITDLGRYELSRLPQSGDEKEGTGG